MHKNVIGNKNDNGKHYPNLVSVMQACLTPPSGITKFIAQNPFEADLTSRLHLSVISPTIFNTKKASPNAQESSTEFRLTVDELATCRPANIDELVNQHHYMSPETEKEAQQAIKRFFSENQIVPSPLDSKPKDVSRKLGLATPTRNFNSSFETPKIKKDAWTQTILSLPVNLPEELENALKPYFTFTQDQSVQNESEDANSTNSSLRRKLFDFQNESQDSDDSDNLNERESFVYCGSPPQSGILADCTPLKGINMMRDHGTPMRNFRTPAGSVGDFSPINISPIRNFEGDRMSCQSIKARLERPKSVARLDFTTDMSIDDENKQLSPTGFVTPDRSKRLFSKLVINEEVEERTEFVTNKMIRLEDESTKIYSSTFQQNNTIYNQQCTTSSRCSQDAGYQTASLSNMDTNDDITWSEDTSHIFCSTPSKNRQFAN